MKKNYKNPQTDNKTTLARMRRCVMFCLLLIYGSVAAVAQDTGITLKADNQPISDIISRIEAQTDRVFIYSEELRGALSRRISIDVEGQQLEKVLDELFSGAGINYRVRDKQITLSMQPAARPQASPASGQKNLKGTVISTATNQPIPGVSVFVEGTTTGTSTGLDGSYNLTVPASTREVTFRMIGYDDRVVAVADSLLFRLVMMYESAESIDEVVVVGFGTQKKESLVGAVQSVKPSDLKVPTSNLTSSFAGRIAGMISVQTSGEPGADASNFWIRGVSTFGYNTSPLIIIDGVEVPKEMLDHTAPETIESFSVLKDATATALYGSRGANGVLIVTTKEGRNSEKMTINVRAEAGVSMPTSVQKIADGVTYMENFNEALWTRTAESARDRYQPYYSQDKIDGTRNNLDPYVFPNNDWYKMLFKDMAWQQNVNINIRGGGSKITYFMNAAFHNEDGILKKPKETNYDTNINAQKYIFQNNLTATVSKTTKLSLKMNTQLYYRHIPDEPVGNLFYYTMRANPVTFPATFPSSKADADYTIYGNSESWGNGVDINPYALMSYGYKDRHTNYMTNTFQIDQDLRFVTKGLSLRGMATFFNKTYNDVARYSSPFYYTLSDYMELPDGSYDYNITELRSGSTYLATWSSGTGYRELQFQAAVDYNLTFGEHDVQGMLVYHQREQLNNRPASDEYQTLPFREQGLAGRITYGYRSRYLSELNFGYNGSENFIKGKRFGFFPSAAVGWVVSNEPFFTPARNVVSMLKVRLSYGESGNDIIASDERFPYVSTIDMSNALDFYLGDSYSRQYGPMIATLGNLATTWEVSKKYNAGLDVNFLGNSLNLIFDAYYEKRSGIFMQRNSLSSSLGYTGEVSYGNIGKVNNRGVDASVEYNKAFPNGMVISARGTFTYAHNKIVYRDEALGTPGYLKRAGQPIYSFWGLVADGLFSSQEEIDASPTQTFGGTVLPGDIKYRDLNGDGIIDANDMTSIGNPGIPEIMYGFGANLFWKNFDFSFFFQGVAKYGIELTNFHPFSDTATSGFNMTKWIADSHWSEDNPDPNAKYPRLDTEYNSNNTQRSSFWIRNGSYLRLKSLEFGYTYNDLRFYFAGSNLFTISPFKIFDPELASRSPYGRSNGLVYPIQKTFRIGVQYNF